jgi:hypothetical protein
MNWHIRRAYVPRLAREVWLVSVGIVGYEFDSFDDALAQFVGEA